ncbi:MAG: citrate synthase [Acidimicrobiia bacterium]|jgi:citrate synthase
MSEAVLRYRDRELSFPVVEGIEGDLAIDIGSLRGEVGLVTLDRGFGNTAESRSEVSFLNGEQGILRYRGYPIDQLAEHSSFLEVAYLLLYGELPAPAELTAFQDSITEHMHAPEEVKHLFQAFPHGAHPMAILAAAVSTLATYAPGELDPKDRQAVDRNCRRLIAQIPTIIAWTHRYRTHQPYLAPRSDLEYSSRFLETMFALPDGSYQPDPVVAHALNVLLVLHADHGQNCSTSAVRLVGSSEADLYASIAGGVNALSGPLHGGANQAVVEMLEAIVADGGDVAKFVAKAKDKDDPFRLMGFGHRVYKNFDPRARIIKQAAGEVLEKLGVTDPLLEVALQLEEVALEDSYFIERKLYPNVDFYSGIIYRAIGIPTDMFPVLFAMGRLPGWLAQWREMSFDPNVKIFRPRQVYVGSPEREYVPIYRR